MLREIQVFTHEQCLAVAKKELREDPSVETDELCSRLVDLYGEFIHMRGRFNGEQHSWLLLKRNTAFVLDVRPIFSMSGPLLVPTIGIGNPWKGLYKGDPVVGGENV